MEGLRAELLTFIGMVYDHCVDISISEEEEEDEGGRSVHCEMEIFNATCPVDHVIVMTHARYGRMRISRCVRLDYGHIGCFADVILALDARCSGRQRCELRIPDAELARKKPCPDDLKPYLEAAFRCVKGRSSDCETDD